MTPKEEKLVTWIAYIDCLKLLSRDTGALTEEERTIILKTLTTAESRHTEQIEVVEQLDLL